MADVHPEVVKAAEELLSIDHLDYTGYRDVLAGRKGINQAQIETGERKYRGESPIRHNNPMPEAHRSSIAPSSPRAEPDADALSGWRGKFRRRMGRK